MTSLISSTIPLIGVFNILACLTVPPIHGYFDLMCGVIQSLVFTLLTMVYWTVAKEGHDEQQKK
jgi:F-type H+-transporting ATPase subunit a